MSRFIHHKAEGSVAFLLNYGVYISIDEVAGRDKTVFQIRPQLKQRWQQRGFGGLRHQAFNMGSLLQLFQALEIVATGHAAALRQHGF